MERAYQIRSIIHGEMGSVLQSRKNVIIVGPVVFTSDGENRDLIIRHEGGGHVILCREGIGCAECEIRTTRLQGFCQAGRFSSHMKAGGKPESLQRFFGLKPGPDFSQNRHTHLCPLYP